jgi:hypothetical protein
MNATTRILTVCRLTAIYWWHGADLRVAWSIARQVAGRLPS